VCIRACFFILHSKKNFFPQTVHSKSLGELCSSIVCCSRSEFLRNVLLQIAQVFLLNFDCSGFLIIFLMFDNSHSMVAILFLNGLFVTASCRSLTFVPKAATFSFSLVSLTAACISSTLISRVTIRLSNWHNTS